MGGDKDRSMNRGMSKGIDGEYDNDDHHHGCANEVLTRETEAGHGDTHVGRLLGGVHHLLAGRHVAPSLRILHRLQALVVIPGAALAARASWDHVRCCGIGWLLGLRGATERARRRREGSLGRCRCTGHCRRRRRRRCGTSRRHRGRTAEEAVKNARRLHRSIGWARRDRRVGEKWGEGMGPERKERGTQSVTGEVS